VIGKLLALLLIAVPSTALQAGEVVTWMTSDNPPTYIYSGEFAGQGIGEQAISMLIGALPDYQHRVLQASPARIWYQMAHSDDSCAFGGLRNEEREKIVIYSNRPIIVPGFRLLVLASRLDVFKPVMTQDGEIDLDVLARQESMVGGHIATRLHLSPIDEFINDPTRRVRLEKMPEAAQLFALLQAGRIDFSFISALELPYYARKSHTTSKFVALPIKGSSRYVKGYLYCSKSPLGQSVITRIDALLADDRQWAAFLAPLRQWVEPADFAVALAAQPH
jgi:uncharacterized protein (TIGR02285 family)